LTLAKIAFFAVSTPSHPRPEISTDDVTSFFIPSTPITESWRL
jgi:hypothetical protein